MWARGLTILDLVVCVCKMVYSSSRRFCGLELTTWYELRKFARVLRTLQAVNFSVRSARISALNQLDQLEVDPPFARHTRFPEGRLYICLSEGPWARHVAAIRLGLAYTEPFNVGSARSGDGCGRQDQAGHDAALQYRYAVEEAMRDVVRMEYVFDRKTFERDVAPWGGGGPDDPMSGPSNKPSSLTTPSGSQSEGTEPSGGRPDTPAPGPLGGESARPDPVNE